MRNILSFVLILSVVLNSCKKGGSTPNPGNGGGPTGNGGITITGISPLNPYEGGVITLTGTGFDPDKTKDTVVIGAIVTIASPNYFNPGGNFVYSVANPKTTIISATATEIKFTTDSAMEVYASYSQKFALKVSAGSKSYYTADTLHLKVNPQLLALTATDPYPILCYGAWAGDSLEFFGKGLYGPLTVSIDGKTIDYIRPVDEKAFGFDGTSKPMGFIGIDFFGTATPAGNCETGMQSKNITIVNGDGKTCHLSANFFPGPNSQIISVSIPEPSYQKSKTGTVPVIITGYAMRNFTLVVSGIDEADQSAFHETLGSYGGDQTGPITSSIDVGGLPEPKSSLGADYQVQVKDANGLVMNGVRFTLYK